MGNDNQEGTVDTPPTKGLMGGWIHGAGEKLQFCCPTGVQDCREDDDGVVDTNNMDAPTMSVIVI